MKPPPTKPNWGLEKLNQQFSPFEGLSVALYDMKLLKINSVILKIIFCHLYLISPPFHSPNSGKLKDGDFISASRTWGQVFSVALYAAIMTLPCFSAFSLKRGKKRLNELMEF